MVLTLGEALVVGIPPSPVGLDHADSVRLSVGGSEVNFAIGLARLNVDCMWIGRLGDDPFGRMVRDALDREGVRTDWVKSDVDRPTGVYFREWLDDGVRRPYYYRQGSAATGLSVSDWPDEAVGQARWLHVSGITPALGAAPRKLVERAVSRAREAGLDVSVDPNFRAPLWSHSEEARSVLEPIVRASSVLLLAQEDCRVLFGSGDPELVARRAHESGAETVVVKLGAEGAYASRGNESLHLPAAACERAVDPVGAGDGFDAGFVAGMLGRGDLRSALTIGNYVGARAVEEPMEHAYPTAGELPPELQDMLTAPPSELAATRRGA
ncbi:MAG TPA: sugar kinase [Solirubrobacteraceae bacterium]